MEWTRDLWNISYPSLTTLTPFKSQKILFNDRAMGSNLLQPKGDLLLLEPVKPALPSYTIYSLRAASRSGVLARLVSLAQIGELARRLHYLLKFSPSFYPRHFMDLLQPPPSPPPLPSFALPYCWEMQHSRLNGLNAWEKYVWKWRNDRRSERNLCIRIKECGFAYLYFFFSNATLTWGWPLTGTLSSCRKRERTWQPCSRS